MAGIGRREEGERKGLWGWGWLMTRMHQIILIAIQRKHDEAFEKAGDIIVPEGK